MEIDREMLINGLVQGVVDFAHRAIWDGSLTSAESRLAWLRVIESMLASVVIDHQSEVIKEALRATLGPENG